MAETAITERVPARPRIVSVAIWTMRVLVALTLLNALWQPMTALPVAFICWLIGRGTAKGRAWSAYGGALLNVALVLGTLLAVLKNPDAWPLFAFGAVFNLLVAALLLSAGRALTARSLDHVRWGWVAASASIILFFVVFRVYVVPTGSMEDTILIGDHILTRQIGVSSPTRGQLIVIRAPFDHQQTFTERVVGLGGDHLKIVNKQLFVNGQPQGEPYAQHKTPYVDSYRDSFPSEPNVRLYPEAVQMLDKNVVNGEVVVPAGHYFVMGDNRDSSLDSRYWGFVDASDIIAKPLLIYYSQDRTTDQIADPQANRTIFSPGTVRWERFFKRLR